MRTKLLFIVPPCVAMSELIADRNKTFCSKIKKEVPLGVVSLATYMKFYAHVEVNILDLNLRFYELMLEGKINNVNTPEKWIEKILSEFKDKKFDFCGISAIFNATYGYLEVISRGVKELFPNIVVVAGGGVPSNLMTKVFLDAPCVDIISYGEGERAILGFITAENERSFLENSLSLMTREKLENGFQCSFEFVQNLDEIPTLDFSLIEFEKYSSHAHAQRGRKIISMPLMFSRGCPFNCCFCASHSVHGKRVRYNSLERIKADVKFYFDEYHVNTITVWDDNFFVDKAQAIALLEYFMQLNMTIEFVNGLPVYRMDDDMARQLKRAGVEVVTLAIESGNARVLKDIIHKPLELEMVPRAIASLKKYAIYIKGLFVIGFPGETLEDIQITMDFIHGSNLNWVDIFIAQPLPGSELYDVCKLKGYLKTGDLNACDFWSGNIETEFFDSNQIEEIQVYNTIKKDFVNNLDMQNKNWERALVNFEYVINAKHENPFAYYYAAKTSKKLGLLDKCERYYRKYSDIRNESAQWEKVFQKFIAESVEFSEIE